MVMASHRPAFHPWSAGHTPTEKWAIRFALSYRRVLVWRGLAGEARSGRAWFGEVWQAGLGSAEYGGAGQGPVWRGVVTGQRFQS
jgi:hypothetical protein